MSKTQKDRPVLLPNQPSYKKYTSGLDQCLQAVLFNENECNTIIAMGEDMEEALIQGGNNNPDIRQGKVKFLLPTEETIPMFDKLLQIVTNANVEFQFDIDSFESIQLARYDVGDFYTWHKDLGNNQSQYRKLSVTVQLSAPDEYDGGDLEFASMKASRELGSAIVFPSWEQHRVAPVTRGTRWSLVAWASGHYRFR